MFTQTALEKSRFQHCCCEFRPMQRMLRSFAAMQWMTWWFTAPLRLCKKPMSLTCGLFAIEEYGLFSSAYPTKTSTRHLYLARNFKPTYQANSRSTAHLPIKSDHALQAENDVRSEQHRSLNLSSDCGPHSNVDGEFHQRPRRRGTQASYRNRPGGNISDIITTSIYAARERQVRGENSNRFYG